MYEHYQDTKMSHVIYIFYTNSAKLYMKLTWKIPAGHSPTALDPRISISCALMHETLSLKCRINIAYFESPNAQSSVGLLHLNS